MTIKSKSDYTILDKIIRFCLENKLIVIIFTCGLFLWGVWVNPFDVEGGLL